jgi:hypothetical protein
VGFCCKNYLSGADRSDFDLKAVVVKWRCLCYLLPCGYWPNKEFEACEGIDERRCREGPGCPSTLRYRHASLHAGIGQRGLRNWGRESTRGGILTARGEGTLIQFANEEITRILDSFYFPVTSWSPNIQHEALYLEHRSEK